MSMHIACHGFSKEQHLLLYDNQELEIKLEDNQNREFKRIKKPVKIRKRIFKFHLILNFISIQDYAWIYEGSRNNLKDVHQFYCPLLKPIKKDARNIFVKGSINDVIDNFQVIQSSFSFFLICQFLKQIEIKVFDALLCIRCQGYL